MELFGIILKNVYINLISFYTLRKMTNLKIKTKKYFCVELLILASCAALNIIMEIYTNNLIASFIVCALVGIYVAKIMDNKYKFSIIISIIARLISYFIYIPSIVFSAFLLKLLIPNIQKESILILLFAIAIETVIIFELSRVKRFKNGIAFLRNEAKVKDIGQIGWCCVGIMIITYGIISSSNSRQFATYLFIGILIEIMGLFIWIKYRITKFYKQKLKEKTIEELEKELKDKDMKISKITEENKNIASINHKYSNRIKALERFSTKLLSNSEFIAAVKTEFGEDFTEFEKEIKNLSNEFSSEMQQKVKHEKYLPKTGIFGIDNLLTHMCDEANNKNITFNLKINGNIKYMVKNIINQNMLETLLGDHIKDAIIAIESSSNSYKNILVILGVIEDCYEICIYDTGIEFEIKTLLKLGKEQITTHKETGGSGIGFITTFETLEKTKASLIIEEKHPISNKDYTKAVKIRFDGKQEYKIISYRAEQIKEQTKDGRIKFE